VKFWQGYLPGRKFHNGEFDYGHQPPKDIVVLNINIINFEDRGTGYEQIQNGVWTLSTLPSAEGDMSNFYVSKDGKEFVCPNYFNKKRKDVYSLSNKVSYEAVPGSTFDKSKYINFADWWQKEKGLYSYQHKF
jgi:hypothetical protein